jgi:hypothetical protein
MALVDGREGAMRDIFISYGREDQTRAQMLARVLERRGWSIFWDRRIPTGKSWPQTIGKELSEARCVIVLWSKTSVESTWVQDEADDARRRGVLFPVLIDNVLPPFGFRSLQAADLANWDGKQKTPAVHRLIVDIAAHIGPGRKGGRQGPIWPSYTGASRFVGTSPSGRVTVYVDPKLGDHGLQNARDLLADADRVATANDEIFGTIGGSVNVIVSPLSGLTDGVGGAHHLGCDYATGSAIEVCASFGNSARVSALFCTMLSECSMGGNLCGQSTGEALARWCAAVIGNNALPDFATAPTWFHSGMPNFVNQTDVTDQNPNSTGCGMAFLSWLMSNGHRLSSIAQTMVALGTAGTLAQLYARLTEGSVADAWPTFVGAVQNLPNGITSDDPFGGHRGRTS